nr:type VI secretion system protein TssL, long form [Pantoea sp.]
MNSVNQNFPEMQPADISSEAHTDSPQALGKFLLDDTLSPMDFGQSSEALQDKKSGPTIQIKKEQLFRSESVQQRVSIVRNANNKLLEAAQPLLRALSDMPEEVASNQAVEVLKKSLINEINIFTIVCDEVGISWQKMAIVRYCLCTALDEAAHAKSWGMLSAWSQSNLLNHFEGDNDGGNKFFLLIGRLSMSPDEYADVLDILLKILGLGFEGRYSIIQDGDRQLTKIRRRLLNIIQSTRDSLPAALSPHPVMSHEKRNRARFYLPFRISFWLGIVILSAVFLSYKYWLSKNYYRFASQLEALERIAYVPAAKTSVAKLRLSVLLKPEIDKGLVQVFEADGEGKIIFTGDAMFDSGSENVRPEMSDVLQRVTSEVKRVNGSVIIVGHTDSVPIRTAKYVSNQELSEKRAFNVSTWFTREGIALEKVQIKGAGEKEPVSSNETTQGRKQNRRVEIFVTY